MHTNPDFRDPSHRTLHMHRARSNLTFGPDGQIAFIAIEPEVSLASSAALNATIISSISSTSSSLGDSGSSSAVPLSTSTSLAASSASSGSPSTLTSSTLFTSTIPQAASSPLSSFVPVSTVTYSPTSAGFLPVSVAVVINNPSPTPQPSATTSANTSSATSITQSPAFYIGILLGTVVIIASVATVIAWWIRVRRRNARHHKDLPVRVPWARSDTVSSGFMVNPFNGHSSTDDLERGKIEDAMVLRRGESEKLKLHLELIGDRDVGMPKRTQSYMEEATSPVKRRGLPILRVPSLPPLPAQSTASVNRSWSLSPTNDPLPESVAYPLPAVVGRRSLPPPPSPSYQPESASHSYRSSSRSITDLSDPHPEHRMLPQSAYQHQQQFPTGFGTPREAVIEPRYLSVLDKERRLDSLPEQDETSSHCLSETAADRSSGVQVKPAAVPSESWTTSIRNRMMNVLGISFPEESYACERYTDLPFPTPARARRVTLRKAGWVQHTDGEITRGPSEQERGVSRHSCQEPLHNPFDDDQSSMGLGIDMPSRPSPSSTLPLSHSYVTRNSSHSHLNPTSACAVGPSPFDHAPSIRSYGSAAPLIFKKHLTVKNGESRPVSRASSRYSTISRTGSVMTVLTEKEEAAARALRERWARGGPGRPSRV